jgi:hypothetical protein
MFSGVLPQRCKATMGGQSCAGGGRGAVEDGVGLPLTVSPPSGMFHFERGMFVFPVEAKNFTNHNNIASLDTNLLDIGTSTSRMQSNQRSASCFGQSSGSSVFPCFRWRVGGPIFQMFSFF